MTGGKNSNLFLPEDLTTDILERLPTVSAAIRLRSVSKSWESLLSDHKFIFRNPNVEDQLKILITGFGENYQNTIDYVDKLHYSLRSYETLHEETRGKTPLVHWTPTWENYVFLSCCDGIFCLSRTTEEIVSEILLWNSATSESISLPPYPFPIPRNPQQNLLLCHEIVGFGFDPQTNDYKVVHKIEFFDDVEDHDAIVHAEVYSLTNGSWKILSDDKTFDDWLDDYEDLQYVHQQQEVSRNDKCYWFHSYPYRVCGIIIFDMSKEVFAHIKFSPPPLFRDKEMRHQWNYGPCFMLKGTFIVSFGYMSRKDGKTTAYYGQETWGMLKFGVAESWTKLFVLEQSGRNFKFLEVWKDGAYICSDFDPRKANQDDAIFVFNPTIEETILDVRRLKVEGTSPPFGAHVFTPTQVSLSRQVN